MDIRASTTPIVCDMSNATDTGPERGAEYQRLFSQALVGRERTAEGIRFRLRADDGIEAWVKDLAAREKACCAFFDFRVTTEGDQVLWDASVIDDDIARDILDEFYALPETSAYSSDELERRLRDKGLEFIGDPTGKITQAQRRA